MKVRQHFDFLANFYDDWDSARALALADSLDLDVDARVGSLSRGNSLKVALCSALGQDAKLLLLDEPTAGLDPVARLDCCTDSSRTCTPNRMSPWYSPRTYWKIWTTWISRTCWYCGREGSRSNGPATSPSRTEACHGSLRFLASLPISGPEHAAGRILVAATFAVPATLVITVVAVREQFVSLAASVPAGLLVWAALTAISTLITACHYRFAGERMLGLFARVALGRSGRVLPDQYVRATRTRRAGVARQPDGTDGRRRARRGRRCRAVLVGGAYHQLLRTGVPGHCRFRVPGQVFDGGARTPTEVEAVVRHPAAIRSSRFGSAGGRTHGAVSPPTPLRRRAGSSPRGT